MTATTSPRPTVISVDPAGIPDALKALDRWLLWRYDLIKKDDGSEDWAKVPYQVSGKKASSRDERTWTTFDRALAAYVRGGYDGIAIALGDGLAGGDLDDCLDADGNISAFAAGVLADADVYCDVSPSGRGLKFFGFTTFADGGKEPDFEIYAGVSTETAQPAAFASHDERKAWLAAHRKNGRYFCVTGQVFEHYADVSSDPAPFQRLLDELARRRSERGRLRAAGRTVETGVREITGAQNGTRHNSLIGLGRALAGTLKANGASDTEISAFVSDLGQAQGLPADEAANVADWLADTIPADAPLPDFAPTQASPAAPPSPTIGQAQASPGAPDSAFVWQCFKEDEAGDAQLFAALYRDELCYDHAAGTWYQFDTHHWSRLASPPRRKVWSRVAGAYLDLAAQQQRALETASDEQKPAITKQIDTLTGRGRALRTLRRVNNVLTLAEELLGIAGDEWDCDPWGLAVTNGVIDLRTGQLRPGQPADYIRTVAPTEWRGLGCPAPRWERFLTEIMSGELDRVAFLGRLAGYSINGTTTEHILPICAGPGGRNGKRVFFESQARVLGDYALAAHKDLLIDSGHGRNTGAAEPYLVELRGKRLVYTSESLKDDRLTVDQVKKITGGDQINARNLHEKPVKFMPSHTAFLMTNHKPAAPADDDALWERIRVIEFSERFLDEPDPTKPNEHPRDADLEATLRGEASGILAWMVRGHLAFLRDGLRAPESVKLARQRYRQEEDITPFIDAMCVRQTDAQTRASTLFAAYTDWCAEQGLRAKSQHWFGRQVARQFEKDREGGKGPTFYTGIALCDVPRESPHAGKEGAQGFRTPNAAEQPHHPAPFDPFFKSFFHASPHEEIYLTQGAEGAERCAEEPDPVDPAPVASQAIGHLRNEPPPADELPDGQHNAMPYKGPSGDVSDPESQARVAAYRERQVLTAARDLAREVQPPGWWVWSDTTLLAWYAQQASEVRA